MSARFATQLRSARAPVMVGDGSSSFTMRVEAADIWETVRVQARPDTTVSELGARVVAALFPEGTSPDEFVLKFRGWELLDPRAPLASAGIGSDAIVLLAYRRRRPVR